MTDAESLKEAIEQYETQLAQVQTALSATEDEADKENLLSLKSDIVELINLTKESLECLEGNNVETKSSAEESSDEAEDPWAEEYALFKAQLEGILEDSKSTEQDEETAGASNTIGEGFEQLEDTNSQTDYSQEDVIHKSLLTLENKGPLGNWEKHTRGIGSKLMAQMGYVVGTGLGKNADGRVEPVIATVLPAGKSLDYCMELRENAGGDEDLFSVERRMRRQQQRLERQRQKQYEREKLREQNNVFNFINATLGDKPKNDTQANLWNKSNLKTESNWRLNVASFEVGNTIMRLEKESTKLKESLARHTKGTAHYNNIVMQYNEKQKELVGLRASEKNIVAEQNHRKNKAKLSIF